MDSRRLAHFLIAINIIGFLYGVYYYGDQLAQTSPVLWILVVKCPLQALLFAVVLILADAERISGNLIPFAAAGSLKYGIWTMFVILFYGNYFLAGTLAFSYLIIFLAHFGQSLEGLLLSGIKQIDVRVAIGILALYLFNDYSDYVWNTHPLLPDNGLSTVAAVSIALSFLSIAFVYLAGRIKLDAFRRIRELENLRAMINRSA